MTVTWSNVQPDQYHKYDGIYVYRLLDSPQVKPTDAMKWVQIAKLGAVTRYVDTGVSKNHAYQYRIVAYNIAGSSPSAFTSFEFTSPATPSSLSASKLANGKTMVVAKGSIPFATSFDLQRTTDGGVSWKSMGVGDYTSTGSFQSSSGLQITDNNPPGGASAYRIRATIDSLASGWKTSNTVTTITAPLAPSLGKLDIVYAGGSTVTVSWATNHPDGSAQTAAQVEVTYPDGKTSTFDVTGSARSYGFTVSATGQHKVRVRTKGASSDWGAWSGYSTFDVAKSMQANFTSPDSDEAVIDAMPLTVTWEITDERGVASQTLYLLNAAGNTLYTTQLDGSARSYMFGRSTYMLQNGTDYTLRVAAISGSGLTGEFSRSFSTEWSEPAMSSGSISYDVLELSATVTAVDTTTVESGLPPISQLTVSRMLDDGSELTLGGNLLSGQNVKDRLPPLNTDYTYVVRAYAESGAYSEKHLSARIDSDGMEAFNFGSGAETCLVLAYDASSEESVAHSGETFHFALGRNAPSLPTFYQDGDIDVSRRHSYVLIDRAEYDALRSIARDPLNSICWFRDAWGHRARVKADWSLSYDAKSFMRFDVSADLIEVVWEEPVNG